MAATAAAFCPSSPKAREAAKARSTKSLPEGEPRISSAVGERVEAGSVRGGTGYSCSPRTRSGARLVTNTTRSWHDTTSAATSGAASNTCSKLSSTRSKRLPRR
jgi:hypothetical protein